MRAALVASTLFNVNKAKSARPATLKDFQLVKPPEREQTAEEQIRIFEAASRAAERAAKRQRES